jgi:glycosyltransferase involved in cell wall biosynthesis
MDYALIAYPLSQRYREALEAALSTRPEYLRLPELRRLSVRELLATLARLKADRVFLPLEDQTSRVILPVLQAMASLTRARRIEVIDADLRRTTFSRWQLGGPLSALGAASLAGLARLRACRRELARLVRAPRVPLSCGTSEAVLYLNANLWFGLKAGGSVGHVAGVVNALAERGLWLDYAAVEPAVHAGPKVRFRSIVPPSHWGLPYETNLYRFHAHCVRQLLPAVERGGYRFLYQRMSVGNYAGTVLSRATGTPLVLEYNGSEVWVQKNWGRALRYHELALAAEDACLRHAHLVVTVSQVLGDELVERGVDRQRVVVYPNCMDPAVFDPARFTPADVAALRAQYGIAQDATVAMFLGTFGQWHGVEVLAEAIRRLCVDQAQWLARQKLHFVLVGDGVKMPLVRQILSDPRCQPSYTLTGLVPQLEGPLHLAAADILLSPHVPNADGSRFFGSPTKLFEYMAMGKPIAASDLEQIGEVLRPGLDAARLPERAAGDTSKEVAVLARPGDVEQLIAAIRFLAERPEWRARLGDNARHKALAEYTWDRHVGAILDGLQALAADRSLPRADESRQRTAA